MLEPITPLIPIGISNVAFIIAKLAAFDPVPSITVFQLAGKCALPALPDFK
jgi:hypothetical protein